MAVPPIALFAFRRPEATLRALYRLSQCPEAQHSQLTIYCDGPRTEQDAVRCNETRNVARLAPWCGSVRIVERSDNLGLSRSIRAGVGEQLAEHGKVIVLEDDLLVAKGFLTYMTAALDRYEPDPRVMQVSGQQFALRNSFTGAGFLPVVTSWGWGTWERAWNHFQPNPTPTFSMNWSRKFDQEWSYPYTQMLRDQMRGAIDSWAICWYWSVFQRSGLVLFPPKTLVENVGFDHQATHTSRGRTPRLGWSADTAAPSLPDEVQLDQRMLKAWKEAVRGSPPHHLSMYVKALLRPIARQIVSG